MKSVIRNRREGVAEVNISPLIDMVFILLIFFIVSTVFIEEDGLVAETVEPKPPEDKQTDEPFVLTLTNSGRIWLGEREIGFEGVVPAIRERGDYRELRVTLQIEPEASAERTVRLIDLCEEAETRGVAMKLL